MIVEQLTSGAHLLAAGVFVGSNVLLERVVKRLDAVPPREAARLGELLGTDVVYINFTALIVLGATGIYLLKDMTFGAFAQPAFYISGYGFARSLMIILWLTVIISSSVMTFYLRPRMLPKLPYDVTRDALKQIGERAMAANAWTTRLGRYNLAAGALSMFIGGFVQPSGFS